MKRRGFFALLLAPIMARFLPARPQGIDFENVDRQYREGMLSAESTFDWFTDVGPFPFEPLRDPQTGISIRFVKEWDIQADVRSHRLAFHPGTLSMTMDPLDLPWDAAIRKGYGYHRVQRAGETFTIESINVENQSTRWDIHEFDQLVKAGETEAARQYAELGCRIKG